MLVGHLSTHAGLELLGQTLTEHSWIFNQSQDAQTLGIVHFPLTRIDRMAYNGATFLKKRSGSSMVCQRQ